MTTFTIPGKPCAKRRHRSRVVNGKAMTHNDPKNVTEEAQAAFIASQHFTDPLDGPVILEIRAYFPMPKSWSKKRQIAMKDQPHTQKPDRDNVEKWVMDSLNRIAWHDDCQVWDGPVTKRWAMPGEPGRTVVTVIGGDVK